MDGDGLPEVIFGAWYGKVYVLNGEDGSLVWRNTYCDTGYVQSAPCITDIDGDGVLDMVVAMFRGDHTVYALRGYDGAVLWTFPAWDDMYAGASCGDIDHDGATEIVIGDYSGRVYALNAADGSLKWETPSLGYYIFGPTTIAEVVPSSPGDEVLCAPAEYSGGAIRGRVVCLSAGGDLLWDFSTPDDIERGVIAAEIDGDPNLEVVFAAGSVLYVLNGEDGSEVWEYDFGDSFPVGNAPIAADFDGDGDIDVFCIGGHGTSDTVPNYGRAFAISAGVGGGQMWTMYRHDPYRTGNVSGGPAKVAEARAKPKNVEIRVAPNPFNSTCEIELTGETKGNLWISDLSGRTVKRFSPTGRAKWNPPPNTPAGVYLVNLRVGDKTISRRVAYLK